MILSNKRHFLFCAIFLICAIELCRCKNIGKVLSRQRRYLTFPKGSSLQMGNTSHRKIANQFSATNQGFNLISNSSFRWSISGCGLYILCRRWYHSRRFLGITSQSVLLRWRIWKCIHKFTRIGFITSKWCGCEWWCSARQLLLWSKQ